MLSKDLNAAQFLIQNYIYWGGDIEANEFPALNTELETLLQKFLPELSTEALKQ